MIIAGAVIVPLIVVASFGPSLAAIITHRLATGNFQGFRIISTWPRTIFGTVIGFVLVVTAYVILPAILAADARQLRWSVLFSVGVYPHQQRGGARQDGEALRVTHHSLHRQRQQRRERGHDSASHARAGCKQEQGADLDL
jgi:hypothetical protein